jgi:dextranase
MTRFVFLAFAIISSSGFSALTADLNADGRIDMKDFAIISADKHSAYLQEKLLDLSFSWLTDSAATLSQRAEDLYTDKSVYAPGEICTLTAVITTNNSGIADVRLRFKKDAASILSQSRRIALTKGMTNVSFSITLPDVDFTGYSVELLLGNQSFRQTAVDVSSDWKRYPRYGYITEFYDGQSFARNAEIMNELSRKYHLNCLQYYDWMWRHENVIEFDGDNIKVPWYDWRGAAINCEVLADSIEAAHRHAIAAMPYFQLYCGLDGYEEISSVSRQWGVFSDPAHANQRFHDAGTNIWIFNPANVSWQNHLCEQFTIAMENLDWDGLHLDQLGYIGESYDYNGNQINLPQAMQSMVNRSKDHLDWLKATKQEMQGRDALIFNIVGGDVGSWASDEIIKASKVDVVYSELWANDTYAGVSRFINYAKKNSGGKAVVLPAYMNRYEDTGGFFDTESVLLADAAFFANGAFHLELGDGSYMLCNEFFPSREKQMTDELRESLAAYYNFITANEHLLFSPALTCGDGGLQWLDIEGAALSGDASADTVWQVNRATDKYQIISLINLLGNDSFWRNSANAPLEPVNLPVKIRFNEQVSVNKIYLASPDKAYIGPEPVDFTTGIDEKSPFVSFVLSSLEYWDFLLIDREMPFSGSQRYEAEMAIKQQTAVNTDHSGYSGSGFVDNFTGKGDSVSFYAKFYAPANRTITLRYANAGSPARRSIVVDGEIVGSVDFEQLPDWNSWAEARVNADFASGVHQICVLYSDIDYGAINLDWIEVH